MPSFSFDADLRQASARIPSHRELNVIEPRPARVLRFRDDGSLEEEADAVSEHGGEA